LKRRGIWQGFALYVIDSLAAFHIGIKTKDHLAR
jgi:hypothetical protein